MDLRAGGRADGRDSDEWPEPSRRFGRRTKFAATVVALAVVTPVLLAVGTALAATAPPVPVISKGPSGATAARTATFTYRDSLATVTYLCGLDAAKLKACSAKGTTYKALAAGNHTFKLAAKAKSGAVSRTTTRAWTIDIAAPTMKLTYPVNGAVYGAAAWTAGCAAGVGVCGTAADPHGVASVRVVVQQVSTLKYWTGTAFTSTAVVTRVATGTTSWRLPLPRPPDDSYRVSVQATDKLGNVTPVTRLAQIRIDTVGPASPAFDVRPGMPPATTTLATAQLSFADADTDPALTFKCSLDAAPPAACVSPVQLANLALGPHEFQVIAYDTAHNASAPAIRDWTVVLPAPFTVNGSIVGDLSPGSEREVNLSFTNPNDASISVTAVTIVIDETTTKGGQPNPACSGSVNLVVTQGFNGPVVVPAGTTATLSELGVSQSLWPRIQMPDLNTNQDACKDTSFALSYTGTAVQI